jgi:hypothetical protein
VDDHALDNTGNHLGQVRALGDDVGRLPAQLENDLLEAGGCLTVYAAPDGVRTREAHDIHLGTCCQLLTRVNIAGHDVEHPWRQARLLGELSENQRLQWRIGRWLQHAGAAGSERGGELEQVQE